MSLSFSPSLPPSLPPSLSLLSLSPGCDRDSCQVITFAACHLPASYIHQPQHAAQVYMYMKQIDCRYMYTVLYEYSLKKLAVHVYAWVATR